MRYQLILCDTTGEHRPIARFESDSPFPTVHVGDRFDDTGWPRLDGKATVASPEKPSRYTVHSIKHAIDSDRQHLVHTYYLNLEPHRGPNSPVWIEQ